MEYTSTHFRLIFTYSKGVFEKTKPLQPRQPSRYSVQANKEPTEYLHNKWTHVHNKKAQKMNLSHTMANTITTEMVVWATE